MHSNASVAAAPSPSMVEQRRYRPDGASLFRYLATNPYGVDEEDRRLHSKSFVCIQGPVRSGKSVASIMRLYEAMMGVPITAGKRRSRWLVVRQSYPDLMASTIKTWLEWFPEEVYGQFMMTPPYVHKIRVGNIIADVHFESFSGEEDIPSLKSREYTGIWVNEAQYYSRKMIVAFNERTGWYPTPGGPKFLQLDMNAPPLGHWVPMMRGDAPIPDEMSEMERGALKKPDDWEFIVQPPWFVETMDAQGRVSEYKINPLAENINIVGERAVYELLDGRTKDEIDADLMNRVMLIQPGRPVFPMFVRETHVAKAPLQPVEGIPIHVGLDFGRQPAAVMAQTLAGRWFVLDELTGSNMAAVEFAPILKRRLSLKYPGYTFVFWGDPSGDDARGETDDATAFGVFENNGMVVRKADNAGRRMVRLETATSVMNRMVNGQPALLVSPTCPTLTTGLGGGYVYRRKKVSGSPIYEDVPHKGEFSHPIDALLEIFMGAGESRVMLGQTQRKKATNTLRKVDPYARGDRFKVFAR